MKPAEIRELSDAQLVEKLKEMRAELFNLRFQMATSQLDQHRSRQHREEGHRSRPHGAARPRDRSGEVRCRRVGPKERT